MAYAITILLDEDITRDQANKIAEDIRNDYEDVLRVMYPDRPAVRVIE